LIQNQQKMTQFATQKKEVPLYIRAIESIESGCLHSTGKPGSQHSFEVLWIIKGNGTCLTDLEKFEIIANTIFYLRPGQEYRLRTNEDLCGYTISFTELFFCIGGTGR
jgi:mannose-6-phosphate isomerase-like protein (cupin superfamily)